MLNLQLKFFNCPSAEYSKALALRYTILRVPLGLEFTEEELKKDETDIHVGLFEGEEILACLTLTACENKRMKMRQVAVDNNYQRKGFGQQISVAAEDYARTKGVESMFCNARQTAVRFYEKLGYKIVSDEFTEVNIPHYTMEKRIAQ